MSLRVYEIVLHRASSAWLLQCPEAGVAKIFPTRMEAVARGSARCREERPSRLVVRSTDGRISEQRTYIQEAQMSRPAAPRGLS
jgi:hypothetical protein